MNRKLIIEESETGRVLVGVNRSDCDPVSISVDGTIETVLSKVPQFLVDAEEKWKIQPRFPKYVEPISSREPGIEKPSENRGLENDKVIAEIKLAGEQTSLFQNIAPPAELKKASSGDGTITQAAKGIENNTDQIAAVENELPTQKLIEKPDRVCPWCRHQGMWDTGQFLKCPACKGTDNYGPLPKVGPAFPHRNEKTMK